MAGSALKVVLHLQQQLSPLCSISWPAWFSATFKMVQHIQKFKVSGGGKRPLLWDVSAAIS